MGLLDKIYFSLEAPRQTKLYKINQLLFTAFLLVIVGVFVYIAPNTVEHASNAWEAKGTELGNFYMLRALFYLAHETGYILVAIFCVLYKIYICNSYKLNQLFPKQ